MQINIRHAEAKLSLSEATLREKFGYHADLEIHDILLGKLRAQAAQTKDAANNPALRKAAEQFESMFLQIMIKTMREATASNEEGDLMGSSTTKTYEALFDQEIAQEMAKKGGVGLAKMLVQSFERNQPGQVRLDPSANPATAAVLAERVTVLR